jgi:hypothetical protein
MSLFDEYMNVRRDLQDANGGGDLKRVHARELEQHMKSKKQIYACLSIEGKRPNFDSSHFPQAQIYLPPYNDCNLSFLHQIMTGKKKVSPTCE